MGKSKIKKPYVQEVTLTERLNKTWDDVHTLWDVVDYIKKFPDTRHYPVDFDKLNLGQYVVERTKKAIIDHKIGIFFTLGCVDELMGYHILSRTLETFGVDNTTHVAFWLGMGAISSLVTDKIANYFVDLHYQNKTIKQDIKDKTAYVWNRKYKEE